MYLAVLLLLVAMAAYTPPTADRNNKQTAQAEADNGVVPTPQPSVDGSLTEKGGPHIYLDLLDSDGVVPTPQPSVEGLLTEQDGRPKSSIDLSPAYQIPPRTGSGHDPLQVQNLDSNGVVPTPQPSAEGSLTEQDGCPKSSVDLSPAYQIPPRTGRYGHDPLQVQTLDSNGVVPTPQPSVEGSLTAQDGSPKNLKARFHSWHDTQTDLALPYQIPIPSPTGSDDVVSSTPSVGLGQGGPQGARSFFQTLKRRNKRPAKFPPTIDQFYAQFKLGKVLTAVIAVPFSVLVSYHRYGIITEECKDYLLILVCMCLVFFTAANLLQQLIPEVAVAAMVVGVFTAIFSVQLAIFYALPPLERLYMICVVSPCYFLLLLAILYIIVKEDVREPNRPICSSRFDHLRKQFISI